MARKKGSVTRAGEMICAYLEINEDEFLFFRESQNTIIDSLDPVQFLIPTPETSNVLTDIDKHKITTILNEVLNAGSNAIKEY